MSDCIEFSGYRNKKGYGCVWYQGRTWLAHRAAWHAENGNIPDGALVLHSCDNPACVNLAHLRLGNGSDNVLDMVKRGRHPAAKLNATKVRSIRRMLARGVGPTAIGRRFGVCPETVRRVRIGRIWAHVK